MNTEALQLNKTKIHASDLERDSKNLFLSREAKKTLPSKLDEWVEATTEIPRRASYTLSCMDLVHKIGNQEELRILEAEAAKRYSLPMDKLIAKPEFMENCKESLKLAAIAKAVSKWIHSPEPHIAFFTGLVYELGSSIYQLRSEEDWKAIEDLKVNGFDQESAETFVNGFTSKDLMAQILEKSKAPHSIIDILVAHGDDSKLDLESKKLCNTIKLAEYLRAFLADAEIKPSLGYKEAQDHLHKLQIRLSQEKWSDNLSILLDDCKSFEKAALDRIFS